MAAMLEDLVTAEFTVEGAARLHCLTPGPCMAVSAVLTLSDGREVAVPFLPDPRPAGGGSTAVVLSGPPGGGRIAAAVLLAEDGVALLEVRFRRPVLVPGGGDLLVPLPA
jgi:hypothetical protein